MTTEPAPTDEITDDDLEQLRSRIEALIESQAQRQAQITEAVARQLAPLIHQLEVENAMRERSRATLH